MALITAVSLLLGGASAPGFGQGSSDPLTSTTWGQRGLYAQQSPLIEGEHARLGCWSTAIGQILFLHRLRSDGHVYYTCTNGIEIDNELVGTAYDWSLMPVALDETSSQEEIDQTSTYLYDAATVIQKDFGTGTYVLSLSGMIQALETHYPVEVECFISTNGGHDIESRIVAEIDAQRPCLLYLRSQGDTTSSVQPDTAPSSKIHDFEQAVPTIDTQETAQVYHAVVLDAYRYAAGDFEVHLNFGWEGIANGWYSFYNTIERFDDSSFRWILTFESTMLQSPGCFHVDTGGDVIADGITRASSFSSGSADVAEFVGVSEPVQAGLVLELDPRGSGAYRVTQELCSSLVAGVVSTAPGLVLGRGAVLDTYAATLALAGIVPVKVTNEGGPIQPGDLLVSSSTPGHAMRWSDPDPCPCALVGKALEPMTETEGLVLVLLTAH